MGRGRERYVGPVRYDWLAFLTDYGRRDGFVATCHGVIATIAPDVRVIDVTHDVPPQDVRHGAAVLAQIVPYLPSAVIVGVVDPGVGTRRRGVAVNAGHSVLIGPDNGLLSWAADALGGARTAVSLDNDKYLRRGAAVTFDGRDVFAPAAAHVARGVPIGDLGPQVADLVRLPEPRRDVEPGRVTTEVLTIDHFGNVQLAATRADLAAAGIADAQPGEPAGGGATPGPGPARAGGAVVVDMPTRTVPIRHGRTFADAPPGEPVLYVDSAGHAAVAVNRGSAAAEFTLSSGDQVTISEA